MTPPTGFHSRIGDTPAQSGNTVTGARPHMLRAFEPAASRTCRIDREPSGSVTS